jgi:hypothetical protein
MEQEMQKRAVAEAHRNDVRSWSTFKDMCPVALLDDGAVKKGVPALAANYRGQVYMFSTPEARVCPPACEGKGEGYPVRERERDTASVRERERDTV